MANKRLLKVVIIIVGIGLIISLSKNLYRLLEAGDQVKLAQQRLEELKTESKKLEQERDYFQSEEFVEQEARNRLNMAKPGEKVVILPPNLGENEKQTFTPNPELPNWKKWLSLFL